MNTFITKKELGDILSGLSQYQVDKIFTEIRKKAVSDIAKEGKIIPDKRLLPYKYVKEYVDIYIN